VELRGFGLGHAVVLGGAEQPACAHGAAVGGSAPAEVAEVEDLLEPKVSLGVRLGALSGVLFGTGHAIHRSLSCGFALSRRQYARSDPA
jgi:hypothetical protein